MSGVETYQYVHYKNPQSCTSVSALDEFIARKYGHSGKEFRRQQDRNSSLTEVHMSHNSETSWQYAAVVLLPIHWRWCNDWNLNYVVSSSECSSVRSLTFTSLLCAKYQPRHLIGFMFANSEKKLLFCPQTNMYKVLEFRKYMRLDKLQRMNQSSFKSLWQDKQQQ